MSLASPMLACRGPGPGVTALLSALAACWLLCGLLALANLVLIVWLKLPRQVRRAHLVFFLVCLVWAGVLFAGGFNQSFGLIAFAAFGIPVLVAGQFGHLLILRRRLRPRRVRREVEAAEEYRGLRCVSCQSPIDLGVRICPQCGWTQPEYESN